MKNVVLQPVNELISNSFVDNSHCMYFLGVENAQLEMNTQHKMNFWRNLKERFKIAWDNRSVFRRKKRKRRRRKLKLEETEKKVKFDPSKYSIYDLTEDLQNSISNFVGETTLISRSDNVIQIIGKEDFGSNTSIILYIVNKNETNYRYYAGRKKGFIDINIDKRIDKINEKIDQVGVNYIKMTKILNALFYNINGFMPNQIFLESILISIPNELYENVDIYKVYIKIVNYLSLKTIRNIKSIYDETKTINEDVLCGNCGIAFNKMLNYVK